MLAKKLTPKEMRQQQLELLQLFDDLLEQLDRRDILRHATVSSFGSLRYAKAGAHDNLSLHFRLQGRPYWIHVSPFIDGETPSLATIAGFRSKELPVIAVSMLDHHCSTDDVATAAFCIQRYWDMRDPEGAPEEESHAS